MLKLVHCLTPYENFLVTRLVATASIYQNLVVCF